MYLETPYFQGTGARQRYEREKRTGERESRVQEAGGSDPHRLTPLSRLKVRKVSSSLHMSQEAHHAGLSAVSIA